MQEREKSECESTHKHTHCPSPAIVASHHPETLPARRLSLDARPLLSDFQNCGRKQTSLPHKILKIQAFHYSKKNRLIVSSQENCKAEIHSLLPQVKVLQRSRKNSKIFIYAYMQMVPNLRSFYLKHFNFRLKQEQQLFSRNHTSWCLLIFFWVSKYSCGVPGFQVRQSGPSDGLHEFQSRIFSTMMHLLGHNPMLSRGESSYL